MTVGRPTFRDTVSRSLNRARHRGVTEAAQDAWGRLRAKVTSSHGTLLVLERPTGGPPSHRSDATFRSATPADAGAYARDIATDSERTFRARLSDATRCYLVESRGRLLHASWVTTDSAWTAELDASVTPPAGDAYIYESFTRPETRGRGIYPFALDNICAVLTGRGIERAWIAVEATNAPSVRAISKAGFRPAFELSFRRERGKVVLEPPGGPHPELAHGFVSRAPQG